MTSIVSPDLDALRVRLGGPVIGPDDPEYDTARARCNANADRRPAAIARCTSATNVVAALSFARDTGLEITGCGGGHSSAGASIADDALVIDLRLMQRVTVDPTQRLARCQGGATLAHLDAATYEHGLAVPVGMVSDTGVGGLTLGGGIGWLTRRAGLSLDNLVSAEVVTADGRVVRASAREHPDLFWALRGAGGNFGVVTEFEFALHDIERLTQFAMLFFDLDAGADILRAVRDVVPELGRDLGVAVAAVNAPPAAFVPPELHSRPGYGLVVVGFGDPAVHEAALERFRAAGPAPLFAFVTPMPYPQVQSFQDHGAPWGTYFYDSSAFLTNLTDDAITTITAHVPAKPTPLSQVVVYTLDGAYNDVADADTAFGGPRNARFALFAVGICPNPDGMPTARTWVRGLIDALRTPATGSYVNAIGPDEMVATTAIYGTVKHARLTQIKATYDPDNVFRRNANITPARR